MFKLGGVMEKIRPYLLGAALTAVVILGSLDQAPNGPRWEYLYIEQAGVQFELRDPNAGKWTASVTGQDSQSAGHRRLGDGAGRRGWIRSSAACLKVGNLDDWPGRRKAAPMFSVIQTALTLLLATAGLTLGTSVQTQESITVAGGKTDR